MLSLHCVSMAGWHLIALLALSCCWSTAVATKEFLELDELRKDSNDLVIKFTDEQFKRYGAVPGRDYTLIVFLSANQVLDNPQLHMTTLRREFALVAKAFTDGPAGGKMFFVEMIFEESPMIFHALQATQVPYIFMITPDTKYTTSGPSLSKSEKLQMDSIKAKYPWSAEDMLKFLGDKKGIPYKVVVRTTIFNNRFFAPLATLAVILGAVAAYFLYFTPVVQHPFIWAVGSLLVFGFSVGGGMFNIIRGMPLFMRNKDGQIQLFLTSRGAQLGAEGFIIALGYLVFSFCISLLTYAVPKVPNKFLRTVVGYMLTFGAGYTVYKVMEVYMAKSGYKITSYF